MEAIVLAGGKGTRLRECVSDRPKPLALINGQPFLSHVLHHLVSQGISHLILSIGYMGGQIKEYFGSSFEGIPISYSFEPKPLLTGGAIKYSAGLLKNMSPFFVVNGDTYCPLQLTNSTEFQLKSRAEVVIAVKLLDQTDRYGTILFDAEGKIQSFQEKKKRRRIYKRWKLFAFSIHLVSV